MEINMDNKINQYFILPAAGKRMIAKAVSGIPSIKEALETGTVVIVAGTTNSYVAEEILKIINQDSEFFARRFFRGISLPPKYQMTDAGRLGDESRFIGDVVLVNGQWDKGKTIYDVADNLGKGDIIIKGANAVNIKSRQAAVLIGHPKAGTISAILQAVAGRRVELILPVGLEKRIDGDIGEIAGRLNSAYASGHRYFQVRGRRKTELDAITILTGAKAELVAGGGVCGAEGGYWIAVSGTDTQLKRADDLLAEAIKEPNFTL